MVKTSWAREYRILPLHGGLSPKQQDEAVGENRGGKPRVVVATNVAETSLTIEGVTLVVDSGLVRMAKYDVRRGLETLMIEKVSQASADQRAGRAGRTEAGHCLRLWSREDHAQREESTVPEIHRVDLATVIPGLMAGGVGDVRTFPWFEAPDGDALARALPGLTGLGVIDAQGGGLTGIGRKLSRLPLPPHQGLVLLKAAECGCLEFFAIVMAAMQGRPLFLGHKRASTRFEDYVMPGDCSDFLPIHRAWRGASEVGFDPRRCEVLGIRADAAREIKRTADQFLQAMRPLLPGGRDQSGEPSGAELGQVLLAGFADRLARRMSASTLSSMVLGGRSGVLDKGSVLAQGDFAKSLFLVGEMTEVEGREVQVRLGMATRVEREWLEALFPGEVEVRTVAEYDAASRRVEARQETCFRGLVLEKRASGEPPEDQAASLLAREIGAGNLILKKWDNSVNQWIARVNTFSRYIREMELPAIDEEAKLLIYEQICRGATSYREIKSREVKPVLKSWLSKSQKAALDHYAPERVALSKELSAKVIYHESEGPKISVVIQRLFAVKKAPLLGDGRIPLKIEILGPNQRPVQITDDLQRFWKTSYADVRSQLRGRYPKHAWPTAEELQ